jgi:RNA-binding protein
MSKPRAPGALTSRQRKHLRSLAQRLEPAVWVGDGGLSPGVLTALDEVLGRHELVKVRMRTPSDKHAMAAELAAAARAELCGLIGHTAILYRAHPDAEKRRITLPA